MLLIQQLKDLKRDRANVQPVEDERIPELTDPRLLAETSKLTLRRKPAEANTLLILEPVLKKFVEVRLSTPCLSIPSYITSTRVVPRQTFKFCKLSVNRKCANI